MSKETGLKIRKFLEEKSGVEFNNSGVIAGQSVAEAYFRVNDIDIHTRIKDIDIFNESKCELEKYNSFDQERSFTMRTYGKKEITVHKTSYGFVSKEQTKGLEIIQTGQKGMINLIYAKRINKDFKYVKSVVDTFDINSIQIGLDLSTNELYLTQNFKNFLRHKKLEISNYTSPITSLMRLLEKEEFTKGATLNKEEETEYVLMKSQYYKYDFYFRGKGLSKKRYNQFSNNIKKYIESKFKKVEKSVVFKNKNTGQKEENATDIIIFEEKELAKNKPAMDSFMALTKSLNYKQHHNNFLFHYMNKNFLNQLKNIQEIKKLDFKLSKIYNSTYIMSLLDRNEKITECSKEELEIINLNEVFARKLISKGKNIKKIAFYLQKLEDKKYNSLKEAIRASCLDIDILEHLDNDVNELYIENANNWDKKFKFRVSYDFKEKMGIKTSQISNIVELEKYSENLEIENSHLFSLLISGNILFFKLRNRGKDFLIKVNRSTNPNLFEDSYEVKDFNYELNKIYAKFKTLPTIEEYYLAETIVKKINNLKTEQPDKYPELLEPEIINSKYFY